MVLLFDFFQLMLVNVSMNKENLNQVPLQNNMLTQATSFNFLDQALKKQFRQMSFCKKESREKHIL